MGLFDGIKGKSPDSPEAEKPEEARENRPLSKFEYYAKYSREGDMLAQITKDGNHIHVRKQYDNELGKYSTNLYITRDEGAQLSADLARMVRALDVINGKTGRTK